ncbi:hypothetical protein BDV93DRAFT_339656 [Ceratobasidium sp. AG-I]|nr:hypothetical protein BDV93DRAFT_339656 [Ceratobasidium sp. AG-I]
MRSAEELLHLLWRDRKLFLAVIVHMGPGRQWSSIFFILAICCYVNGDKKFMCQIMDLTHRYSCIATKDDRLFIWTVCMSFNDVPREAFSVNRPVDKQDSTLLMNLFTREIHPYLQSGGFNMFLQLVPPFVDFGVAALTEETNYLSWFCAVGIFARVWGELERKSDDINQTLGILQLSNSIYQFV